MENSTDSQDSSIEIQAVRHCCENQKLIDELKNQIQDGTLVISEDSKLQNIEFISDFEIKTLSISFCIHIIPKLNTHQIKKISINYCRIDSLAELELPNLESLQIKDYNIGKFIPSGIREFKKLKELVICGCDNLDLKLIPQQLSKLEISKCNLKNFELLKQFTQLTNFSFEMKPVIDNTNIDISPISKMVQLVVLNLSNCNLKNVEYLKSLINLKDLNLAYNGNIDISPLQHLINLTKLNLEECSLIDLTYLKPLINLKELTIARNNILYVEPLQKLKQIQYIDAVYNKIIDVSVLNNHPSYSSFEIYNQKQPNKQQIAFANQLRDINAKITSLRGLQILRSNIKSLIALQRKNVDNCLQQIFNTQTQFIQQVASSFQKQNSFEDYQ
ncbi:leucine-rich_repeat domain-containing protein [Hexamita inflata]|uniref:Leucine-rich repeat domain-containing protein n=1 Tax=Hexamita inflata TaxID=28002 RepID=A0AA86NU60_9EUKA|nr:leucine-rich repeat domain-containing protein [Hexamita inflata]